MSSRFRVPEEILYGSHALEEGKKIFAAAGKKAFLVTGKVMERCGNVDKVTAVLEALGISSCVYSGITGEPTDEMITEGVRQYRNSGCDFLIGLGGGSPMDAMKAIGAMVSNDGEIASYMGKEISRVDPVMIAIPTTAGTGSEATWFTVITDTKRNVKMLLKGNALLPDVALVDYRFSISAPKSVTCATGLDALTHAVEGYTSRRAQPMTDTLALSAVQRIFRYLPAAYRNGKDEIAREQMAIAALEAGMVINNSSVTLVHGMSRPIGALFHVPHGLSNAMLLKGCIGFALDGAYDRFAALGRAIGAAGRQDSDQEAAEKFLAQLETICQICQVPTLQEYGIGKEAFTAQIHKMAEDAAASGSPANTRKPVTVQDMEMLYHAIWNQ